MAKFATKERRCIKLTFIAFCVKVPHTFMQIWQLIACYVTASNKHSTWKTYAMCVYSTNSDTFCVKVAEKYAQYARVNSTTNYTFCVETAQRFTQYVYTWTLIKILLKSSTHIQAKKLNLSSNNTLWVNPTNNYTFCVKVAQRFMQYE